MEDEQDVICLSSDEETTTALPKKARIVVDPVKQEVDATGRKCRDTDAKRKAEPQISEDYRSRKKTKVSENASIEEITLELPCQSDKNGSKGFPLSLKPSKSTGDPRIFRRQNPTPNSNPSANPRREGQSRDGQKFRKEEVARGVRNFFTKYSASAPHPEVKTSRTTDADTRQKIERISEKTENSAPKPLNNRITEKTCSRTSNLEDLARKNFSNLSGDTERPALEGGSIGSPRSSRVSTDSRTSRDDPSGLRPSLPSDRRAKISEKSIENNGTRREPLPNITEDVQETTERSAEEGTRERPSDSRSSSPSRSPKLSSISVRTPGAKITSEKILKLSPITKKSSPEVEIVGTSRAPSRLDEVPSGLVTNDADARSSDARSKGQDTSIPGNEMISSRQEISSELPETAISPAKKDECSEKVTPKRQGSPVGVTASSRRITPLTLTSPKKSSELKNSKCLTSSRLNGSPRSSCRTFEPIAGCSKTPDDVSIGTSFPSTSPRLDSDDDFAKPHLVVKAREPVISSERDTFSMFLGLCLQTDRCAAMEKIVGKLKRHYEQLDPAYARSRSFNDMLNKARVKMTTHGRVYYYIGQVFDEMKIRRRRDNSVKSARPEGSATCDKIQNGEDETRVDSPAPATSDATDRREHQRLRQKIRTIEIAMKKCARKIEKLEVAEVNFDDENDSHYIMLSRYKEKMIELYAKHCEYTNEHADAGRAYLRPKHLRVTQIPSIDQAINSFVNSKLLGNRKKRQNGRSFVDGLIFPDYVDILECVARVNEEQKLGLDKRRQQKLAEEAFTQLGKILQDARQKDYWDTFSLHLEDSEDPAKSNPELSEKLQQNQEIAKKNTLAIFEEYVRKQEEKKADEQESKSSEAEDDDEEDDEDDEDVDNEKKSDGEIVLSENEDNSVNPENIDEKGQNNERAAESARDNVATTTDEGIEECAATPKKHLDLKIVDSEAMEIEESNSEAESPGEQIRECTGDESTGVSLSGDETTGENNNVVKCLETKTDRRSDDAIEPMKLSRGNGKTEIDESDADDTGTVATNEPDTEPPKIIRIRSFAKPPSSWASSREMDKSSELAPATKTPGDSETIDLLDDETPSPPPSPHLDVATTKKTTTAMTGRLVSVLSQQRGHVMNGGSREGRKVVRIIPKSNIAPLAKQLSLYTGITVRAVERAARNGQPSHQPIPTKTTLPILVPRLPCARRDTMNSTSTGASARSLTGIASRCIKPRIVRNARSLSGPHQLWLGRIQGTAGTGASVVASVPTRPRPSPYNASDSQTSRNIQSAHAPAANVAQVARARNEIRSAPASQVLQRANTQQSTLCTSNAQPSLRASNVQPSLRTSNVQPLLRTSNAQSTKATPPDLRPGIALAMRARGTTVNNSRNVRLPANAFNGATTVARLTEAGQLRVERVDDRFTRSTASLPSNTATVVKSGRGRSTADAHGSRVTTAKH